MSRPLPARTGVLVTTLLLAMASSTLLQGVFSALGPFLTDDLALSRAQLGTLTTAMYLTGAVLSPAAGHLVDRWGGRRLLLGLFGVTSLGLAAAATAPTYPLLVAAALLFGLSVSAGNPVTNLLVAAHAPRARQGVITGLKQSGVQVGIFASGALLPPLAAVAGWRAAALAALVVPVAGLMGTRWAVPHDAASTAHETQRARAPLSPATRWLTAYALGMGIGISALGAYLPLYGAERLGLPRAIAGWLAALVGAVGVVARIAWGRAADRRERHPSRALTAMAVVSLAACGLVAAAEPAGVWLAWTGAALAGATAAAWNSVGMLAIVRGVDRAVAGRASGMVLLSFYFGFVVGPTTFGVLVDATGRWVVGWAFAGAAFLVAALVGWRWAVQAVRSPSPGTAAPAR